MRKIIAPRAGGKTIELIKMSAETGAVIAGFSEFACRSYIRIAKDLGLEIPKPVTHGHFLQNQVFGLVKQTGHVRAILIDDADYLIQSLSAKNNNGSVIGITMDLSGAEISTNIYVDTVANAQVKDIFVVKSATEDGKKADTEQKSKKSINTTNTTSTMRGLVVGDRVVVTGSPRGKDDYNIGKVAQVMLIEPFNDDQDMIAVREFNDVKGEWYGYEEIYLSPFPPVEQIPSDNSDEKSSKVKAFAEDIAAYNRKFLDLGRRGPDATGTYTMGGFPQSATANKEVEAEDKPDQEKTATTETPAHNFEIGDVVVVLDPTGYSHIDRGDTGRVVSVYESHANVAMHKNNAVIGFQLSRILALNKSQKQKQNTVYDFKIGDRAVALVPYSCGDFHVPSSIVVDITFIDPNYVYAKAIDSRYKEYDLLYKPTELIIAGSTEAKS